MKKYLVWVKSSCIIEAENEQEAREVLADEADEVKKRTQGGIADNIMAGLEVEEIVEYNEDE